MSVEFEAKVVVDIECANCGSPLNAHMGGKYSWSKDMMKVEPCEYCLNEKYEEGKIDAE